MKKSTIVALFVVGAGTGWLAGLSFSPVVGTIVASVLGVTGAVVAAAAGVPLKDRSPIAEVRAAPLAALVAGIALLAPLGVLTRDHGWLAPSVEEEVRRTLLLRMSGLAEQATSETDPEPPRGGLKAGTAPGPDACTDLLKVSKAQLRPGFEATGNEVLVRIAQAVSDTFVLGTIRNAVCLEEPPRPEEPR